MQARDEVDTQTTQAIAVVGMGCRFAQAATPQALWENLVAGVDPITEVPADRFDIDGRYDPRPAVPGRCATRWGSFIAHIHAFDHAYFRLSPREASRMDPQQRVLLEVAAETLDDAGLSRRAREDFRTGVFVGCCTSDWEVRTLNDVDSLDLYACTGVTRCTLSGRLSFSFDLRGPSMTIDAGCSSSLLAIHLACQSLRARETDLALAGGVNMILDPGWTVGFSQAQMLSPDGRCKTFDSRANGFVRADGCGVVALMTLPRARAFGARIYAVIRGSGVSNDGASNGLLATPSALGQQAALRAAYQDAGLSPHAVQYIEAHGTGTAAGDPVEIAAISSVMQGRSAPCLVGSVKSNIGHAEGAAGVAGFIKTCLAVHHRQIPSSQHFEQPSPHVVWDGSVQVVNALTPWPQGVARAGVSSFGISGTDVHVVIEEHRAHGALSSGTEAGAPLPLLLSSTSPEGLRASAEAYARYLSAPERETAEAFRSACFTSAVGRDHELHRLGVVADSGAQASAALRAYLTDATDGARVHGRAREHAFGPVLVFSGQGSQWVGMGSELLATEPVFRRAVEACDEALRPYIDARIVSVLESADEAALQSIDLIQPSLFALQVGLSALWRALGLTPSLVIGHSMGEIAAAHCVGILSLDDAARVVCSRSQLLKRTSGRGGMLAVELPIERAREEAARFPGQVGVAVSNSSSSTVLSGEPALLRQLEAELVQRGVYCRFIAADVAGHSPQLDPLLPELATALASIQPSNGSAATTPMFSTVEGNLLDPSSCTAAYWVRNLREPVLFSSALQTLIAQGHDTFVEVSPHPILGGPIRQLLEDAGRAGSVHASLNRDEPAQVRMRATLAALHCEGHSVELGALYPERPAFVSLPPYAWQREPIAVDMRESERNARAGCGDFSLLGAAPAIQSATQPDTSIFQSELSLSRLPYLGDHRVRGVALMPGAAYLDMALTAAHELLDAAPIELHDVRFDKALPLRAEGSVQLQLVASHAHWGDRDQRDPLGPADQVAASMQCFTRSDDARAWTAVASLRARVAHTSTQRATCDLALLRAGLELWPAAQLYRAAQKHGIEYGPAFQGVRELWLDDDCAVAHCSLPSHVPVDARQRAHAALLDACMQTLAALVLREGETQESPDAWLPVGVASLRLLHPLGTEVWVHARRHTSDASADRLVGDLVIYDGSGRALMEVDGFTGQRVARHSQTAELDSWLHELRWQPAPAQPAAEACFDPRQTWLVFADHDARVGARVAHAIIAAGARCVVVHAGESFARIEPDRFALDPSQPEHFTQLLDALGPAGAPAADQIVHLWSLDAAQGDALTAEQLDRAMQRSCLSITHLVQSLELRGEPGATRKLWIITRAAHKVCPDDIVHALQAPVWALARVLRYEHTELDSRCIDLGASDSDAEVSALLGRLATADAENELALRGTDTYAARLVAGVTHGPCSRSALSAARTESFRVEPAVRATATEACDDLQLTAAPRPALEPNEVEIEVRTAALSPRDDGRSFDATDAARDFALGHECAGYIRRVGEAVHDFKPGQPVLALTALQRGAVGRFVATDARWVLAKPETLDFEQAAALPLAALTANYALCYLGRLTRGERVLILGAPDSVGLVAAELARALGAEVLAGPCDEEQGRQWQRVGAQPLRHASAAELRACTHGEGVDLVFQTDSISTLIHLEEIMRPCGRVLLLGSTCSPLPLPPLRAGSSVSHVDVLQLLHDKPQLAAELLRDAGERIARGEMHPPATQRFPVTQVSAAVRAVAEEARAGKVVLDLDDPALSATITISQSAPHTAAASSYLITGGLGGLGLVTAEWLAQQGAEQLILLGRRAPSEAALARIERLRAAGVTVWIRSCDVGDRERLRQLWDELSASALPLRGVVHCAGVLDDGLVSGMSAASFERVMRPKLHGAYNLDLLTRALPLDFFVLYSSGAATLGSPGQGNYAAANAFLDALAERRRALGLPALSIAWGPWRESGLAVRPDRAGRLGDRGLGSMSDEQGVRVLDRLLRVRATSTAVFPAADWQRWAQFYPVATKLAMLATLLSKPCTTHAKPETGLRQRIAAADPATQAQQVESYLLEQMSRVLKATRQHVLDPELALTRLGVDSLMALELRNRVDGELGVQLPVSKILLAPSARQLALDITEELRRSVSAPESIALDQVTDLSDAQVDSMLRELLGKDAADCGN